MTVAVIIKATDEYADNTMLAMVTVAVMPKEGIETNDCCCYYYQGCRYMRVVIYILLEHRVRMRS